MGAGAWENGPKEYLGAFSGVGYAWDRGLGLTISCFRCQVCILRRQLVYMPHGKASDARNISVTVKATVSFHSPHLNAT